ncbi:unnamed protein product, partial [Didymodactylos carnosus]
LATIEEMVSLGLYLNDLNFYDGTSEMLTAGTERSRQLKQAIDRQQTWIAELENSKIEYQEWRKKSRYLLYSMMPKHIALMLQEGIQPNSICESHKMITIMFSYTLDFKELASKLDPIQIINSLNQIVSTFDQCTDKFDVFKVETKADLSYMVVGGLKNRLPLNRR